MYGRIPAKAATAKNTAIQVPIAPANSVPDGMLVDLWALAIQEKKL